MTQLPPISRLRPVIRVFVSSTFSDLKHERDALQREVFPKLEQFCASRQFQFQAIDLRWGISSEAGDDHRTMRICFDELRRSQEISPEPNFLILLGNRYGMRPLPEEISQAEYAQLAAAAQFGGEHRAPLPGTHGKTAIQVLRDWYRCDENVLAPVPPNTEPDRAPLNYILQPRTQDLHDGRDYTRTNQKQRTYSQDWRDVQQVLRRIVDVAFPVESLDHRFDHIDWPQHVARVNDSGNPSRAVPQIVRFHGSATEQEIWHGALSAPNAERHVLAFFRDITNRDGFTPEEARVFYDLTETRGFHEAAAKRQNALRKAIAERLGQDATVRVPYSRLKRENGKVAVDVSEADTKAFCDAVFERFSPIIERQMEAYWRNTVPASPDRAARDLEIEQREYERFAEERGGEETFVGRRAELQAILDYMGNDSRWPLLIHGASGCGKTALLARASQEVAKTRNRIERFIGVAPRSSDLRSLLSSLCQELRQRNPRANALPNEIKELRDEFSQHLQAATPEQPLILLLDALDQLADADNGRMLNWLPPGALPAHVKLVVSCLSDRADGDLAGQPYAELKRRPIPAENFVNLDVLSEAEARLLLFDRWLPKAGRKVSDEQRAQIEQRLASPACRQPIFLKLLFDEVQLWRSYDPPAVLGESVPELLGQLFDRLSQPTNHGPLLVNRVLGYLSASRHGLAENEILEILFVDPDYEEKLKEDNKRNRYELPPNAKRIPIALWSRLRFDLAPYLTERAVSRANVLTFYHGQVAEWVRHHLVKASNQSWRPHRRLADYFEQKPISLRRDNELPWYLCKAELWSRLNVVLSDPEYLGRSFDANESDIKIFWNQLESHSEYTMVKAYEPIFQTGDRHADLAPPVAALLDNAGHLGESVSLWMLLWSSVRATYDLETGQSVLGLVGLALFESGDISGAMQAYEEQERTCLRMLQDGSGGLCGLQASLGNQGEVFSQSGKLDRALDLFRKQEAICREIHNDDGLQHSLGNQGSVLCKMGKFAEARELLGLQERICQEKGDTLHLHVARSSLAAVDYACGYLDRAMAQLRESEVGFRELGNKTHLVSNLTMQGSILAKNGDSKGCLLIYEEAEAICALLGDRKRRILLLGLKGSLLQTSRRWVEALKAYEEEERLCRKFGERADLQEALRNQAALHMDFGELERSLELCAEAEEICTEIGSPQGIADALFCRGQIFQVQGDLPRALHCLQGAEKNFVSIGHQYGVATVRVSLALVAQSRGHFTEALSLLGEAKSAFEELGNRAGIAMALGHQGLILRAQGRLREAMSMHKEEMRIVRELNDEDGTARSLGNQAVLLKDFGELNEALRLHEEEERISRKLESKERIQVSLGNQAVVHTIRSNFEKGLTLQSEKEKLCRELGNKHSLATSLGGQANIRYEQGQLAEAIRLYREEERLCRELGNPAKLATTLYNQAVARNSDGQICEALRVAEEAYLLATLNELPLSATIIQFLDHLRYRDEGGFENHMGHHNQK